MQYEYRRHLRSVRFSASCPASPGYMPLNTERLVPEAHVVFSLVQELPESCLDFTIVFLGGENETR